jgi:hypothetical protein
MSFVPGMTGLGSGISQNERLPLTSVSKINHSLSFGTASISWPTGIRAGDLAFLYDWSYVENDGGDPGFVMPTGFTSIVNAVGNSGEVDPPNQGRTRVIVSYRILDGLENPEGSLVGMSGNRDEGKILLLFRGNVRIRSVVAQSLNAEIQTASSRVIASASGGVPLITWAFGAANVSSQIGFSVNSPAFSEVINNTIHMTSGYKIYTSAPADHTVDGFTGSGTGYGANLVSGYLELA